MDRDPAAADLPVAQLVPTTVAQALPGGSVQTWPSPGNPGAPTYWPDTERVGYFDAAGSLDHDDFIDGTYHNGTGLGKLTYIGGHSFSTAVPYSGNFEGPYLRAFYNSLFFNGSAVAKLDLTYSPTTYPQNGTGLLTANIANTGASVATNVRQRQRQAEPRLHVRRDDLRACAGRHRRPSDWSDADMGQQPRQTSPAAQTAATFQVAVPTFGLGHGG